MRVSTRNAAIVAGLVTAIYLGTLFTVRRVPDWVLGWLGGPTGIARDGGLVLRYRPPAGYDATVLEHSLGRERVRVQRDGAQFGLEVPGVDEANAAEIVGILEHGGLEFRDVIEDTSLYKMASEHIGGDDFVAPGVRVDMDWWLPEQGGDQHSAAYLSAARVDLLVDAFAQLRARGWVPPPHSIVAFERVEARDSRVPVHWRSYLLGDTVLLDGDAMARATASRDPLSEAPVVLADYTTAGGKRFAEVTTQRLGHKLATVLGGQVRSAVVLNGPIRGGRATITLGALADANGARAAEVLAAVLSVGAIPAGGVVEKRTWTPPPAVPAGEGLARVVLGLVGGVLVGALVGLVVRVARPEWQPPVRRGAGRIPARRVAVTLLAPIVLLALQRITSPAIDAKALSESIYARYALRDAVIGHLGIAPILFAFIGVELATLVVPGWRKARYDLEVRIATGRAVAVVSLGIALIQSYLVVQRLAHELGGEIFVADSATYAVAVLSPVAATALLAIVAGAIRTHGLGNGYGALLVSAWAIQLAGPFAHDASLGHALGLVTLVAIGVVTVALLRMRVGADREIPLRVPSSGLLPVPSMAVAAGLWLIVRHDAPWTSIVSSQVAASPGIEPYLVGLAVVVTPLWSLACARPAVLAPLLAGVALAPPSRASWWRATALSLLGLLGIIAAWQFATASHRDAGLLCDAVTAMMATAVLLDVVDDLRARRGDLVAVWPLHHAQHGEVVRRVLADAGIACHLQSSHLRTLYAFFGPYVPVDVLVPSVSADAARARVAALFDPAPVAHVLA